MMLSETKQNLQEIIAKIQLLDMSLETLNRIHKDQAPEVDERVKTISTHKLKLVDEIIRLSI